MPAPEFSPVNVNEELRNAVRLFEPQFNEVGKPTITTETFLRNRFLISMPIRIVASGVSESGAKCVRRHACALSL